MSHTDVNFEVVWFAPKAVEQQQSTFKLVHDAKNTEGGPHKNKQIISALSSSTVVRKRSRSGASTSQIHHPNLSMHLI